MSESEQVQNYLLASSKYPIDRDAFIAEIKRIAEAEGCELVALIGIGGPGCYNYGFSFKKIGPYEKLMQSIAMSMQPGKYCETCEEYQGFDLETIGPFEIRTLKPYIRRMEEAVLKEDWEAFASAEYQMIKAYVNAIVEDRCTEVQGCAFVIREWMRKDHPRPGTM